MKKFEDLYKELNDGLSELLTADNTDTITKLKTSLDNIKDSHESQETEIKGLKDKMVDIVRNTSFKQEPPQIDIDEPKSLDEIMSDELNKILAKQN